MEFLRADGAERLRALRQHLSEAVVALDYDGTLAPIVDDPTRADIHPDAPQALLALSRRALRVAIVTGRPVAQVLDLGGLARLADQIHAEGHRIDVVGQYGAETWNSTDRELHTPPVPPGLGTFRRELPGLLEAAGVPEAWIEEKGLGVAVHTRRTADPAAALALLADPVADLATRHDLVVEPGRAVLEVRSGEQDKGRALGALLEAAAARAVCFAGDDLGDVSAFDAVDRAADRGLATLLVCAGSAEQPALRERADVVVDGPAGVVALLASLAPHRL